MQPHWFVQVGIGAIVGLALPYTLKVGYYFFKLFKKTHLDGLWYNYHWSYKNKQPVIFESTWEIKRGILQSFAITACYSDSGLLYKGHIRIEGDQLMVVFGSTQHSEHPVYRFPYPIQSNCQMLHGLWLSFDHDKNIASGGAVVSRSRLTVSQAEEEIKRTLKSERHAILLRAK